MGSVTMKWNSDGFRQILEGPGVQQHVEGVCEAMAARAGDGFTHHTFIGNYGGGRVIGIVQTGTRAARRAEAVDKALSRAVMG